MRSDILNAATGASRPVPGRVERLVHWLALVGSFLLLGGIVMFADFRPATQQAALKPALETHR
ncbi:MAG: hypothetical protein CTY25_10180 [Methylobacterium sp.]|nr:MAG: hypothetical protein CTY25_10180 [Methylobacterium sp.]